MALFNELWCHMNLGAEAVLWGGEDLVLELHHKLFHEQRTRTFFSGTLQPLRVPLEDRNHLSDCFDLLSLGENLHGEVKQTLKRVPNFPDLLKCCY